jgi:predicted enzyme related to lactoylglutathione lyase
VFSLVDHTIVHFEIPAKDVEKLKKFYSELFGWKIYKPPGPIEYWIIETVPGDEQGMTARPGVNGGMYKKDQPQLKPVNYILVEDVAEYIQKIEDLGGTIIRGKQEVPSVGWIALGLDPEGNSIAILESMR